MSMYGYEVSSFYDYGFSDPAITGGSIYGNSISPMAAAVDYDDELYVRRRPPPRQRPPPIKNPSSSPPRHRHDGTSPLPLGMDWNLAPLIWEGRNSVWPHELHKGWSFCVTIPSLSSQPSDTGSVFYGVKVGIQSPEGVTTTRTVPRRFNEFLKLYTELKNEFPKKNLPPAPPKGYIRTRSKKVLVDRICALECWMTKLLSDIDVSRTAPVAIFLDLEAAAREACYELNQTDSADMNNSCAYETSDLSASSPEKENDDELNIENVSDRGIIHSIRGSSRDIEDLITRLNQETVARQYFTTKVKDLEMELETRSQSSKDMQCDMEELQRECIELELRLTIEQEARAYAESMKETMIQKNELLMKELDDAKEQVEILRKQKEEMELKSKSDVLEDKSLGTSHLELKQELGKFSEDKVMVDTCVSLSDTIDILETSDTQIGLLLAKAQVLSEDAETGSGFANEDDELRKLLGDILIENAKLRKQVNSVISHALNKTGKDNAEDDKCP